jgi:hypothetical protein
MARRKTRNTKPARIKKMAGIIRELMEKEDEDLKALPFMTLAKSGFRPKEILFILKQITKNVGGHYLRYARPALMATRMETEKLRRELRKSGASDEILDEVLLVA